MSRPRRGRAAAQRPVSVKRRRIAMVLGFVAILIGVFFYTLNVATMAR